MSVKSGCDAFGSLSGSSAGGGVFAPVFWANEGCGHKASNRAHVSSALLQRIERLLVVRRTDLDPPFDDCDLAAGQVRWPAERHPHADDARPAFELLNQIAVLWIAGNHTHRSGLPCARHVDQIRIGDRRREIESAEAAQDSIVTLSARGATA